MLKLSQFSLKLLKIEPVFFLILLKIEPNFLMIYSKLSQISFSLLCSVTDRWLDSWALTLEHPVLVWQCHQILFFVQSLTCDWTAGPSHSSTQYLCDNVTRFSFLSSHWHVPRQIGCVTKSPYYCRTFSDIPQVRFTKISLFSPWGLLFFTLSAIKLNFKSNLQPTQPQGTDKTKFSAKSGITTTITTRLINIHIHQALSIYSLPNPIGRLTMIQYTLYLYTIEFHSFCIHQALSMYSLTQYSELTNL